MADPTEGGNKEFAAFLKSCRPVEELTSDKLTTLRGTVYRSGDAAFAIQTADGQLVELEPSAVDRFKVIGTGLNPEVELSLTTEGLTAAKQLKSVIADGGQTIFAKDIRTDPIVDHKHVIKDLHTDPIADQTLFVLDHKLPHKDLAKDPITDPVGTATGFDPIGGTAVETLAEGGFDPGQVATNPAMAAGQQAGAPGMMPFVMATPHHAPAQMVNLQMGAAGAGASAALKPFQSDTIKELSYDHTLKEMIHDTHKEVIFDTRKELIYDTHKEVFETYWEGGGTLQEGAGTAAEGSQFPGGFPGMPGF
jgi:hypothetical protein